MTLINEGAQAPSYINAIEKKSSGSGGPRPAFEQPP